jgi:cytochrome c
MKSSGIIWSAKHIFVYVTNPGKHIPGNKMAFAGIQGSTEKAHLIAFLETV